MTGGVARTEVAFRPLLPESLLTVSGLLRSLDGADLDGDGDLDLATISQQGELSIFRNDGAGTFAPPVEYTLNATCLAVTAADLDGDGDRDLAVANGDTNNGSEGFVLVLANRGDGTLDPPVAHEAEYSGSLLFAVDLDGDGDLDLATGDGSSGSSQEITVLRNRGDASFDPPSSTSVGGYRTFAPLDVEGDGDVDLAVLLYPDGLSILVNDGTGIFTPQPTLDSGDGPVALATGDLDRDGDTDIAIANVAGSTATPGSISVLLNQGDGTFAPRVSYGDFGPAFRIVACDHDGDGDLDLLVGTRTGLEAFRNRGGGSFGPQVTYSPVTTPQLLLPADLDGDRYVDLAFAEVGEQRVGLLRNDHGRRFETLTRIPINTRPAVVRLADVDQDARPDLLSASDLDDTLSIRRGDGTGGFAAAVSYATGLNPEDLTTGDLDADGDLDVVVASRFEDAVSIHRNQGWGTFAPQAMYATGASPLSVVTGDLDGDGALDLALSLPLSAAVLLNDGGGAFAAPAAYLTGFGSSDVAVGDLDADGDLDLAVSNAPAGVIKTSFSVLLNEGDGTFAPQVRHGQKGSLSIATGDLDLDGSLDVAVANESALVVFRNGGDATFAPRVAYPTALEPDELLLGDLDGDGDLEIGFCGSRSLSESAVSVLRNAGDGTFGPSELFATVSLVLSLACGDLDGDRDLDLVTASIGGLGSPQGTFSVLRNQVRRKPRVIDGLQDPFVIDTQR